MRYWRVMTSTGKEVVSVVPTIFSEDQLYFYDLHQGTKSSQNQQNLKAFNDTKHISAAYVTAFPRDMLSTYTFSTGCRQGLDFIHAHNYLKLACKS